MHYYWEMGYGGESERYTSETRICVSSLCYWDSGTSKEGFRFYLYNECRLRIVLSMMLHSLIPFLLVIRFHHYITASFQFSYFQNPSPTLVQSSRFDSSESTQVNTLLLAPHAEFFPRTAVPHILFDRGYQPSSVFIIDLIVQSMLDQFIGIGKLWQ